MKLNSKRKAIITALSLGLLTGCASSVKTVPLKVQSDPLGAHVLFQVQADIEDKRNYDWVYLGSTPLDTRRSVSKRDLKKADAFVMRVIKNGYLDQTRSLTGEQLVDEAKSKGAVYWNPKMVKSE